MNTTGWWMGLVVGLIIIAFIAPLVSIVVGLVIALFIGWNFPTWGMKIQKHLRERDESQIR